MKCTASSDLQCSSWLHKADMTSQMLRGRVAWGNSQGVLHISQNPNKLYLEQALALSRNNCELWYCSAHELLADQWSMKAKHAEFTEKTKPSSNLPPVKTCCCAVQCSAITEHMWESKAEFPHLACLMSALRSSEHRERPEQLWCTAGFVCSLNLDLCGCRHMPHHETLARRSREWQHRPKQAVKVQRAVTESQPFALRVANEHPLQPLLAGLTSHRQQCKGMHKPSLSKAVLWTPAHFSCWLTLAQQPSNALLPPRPRTAPLHPHSTSAGVTPAPSDSTICNLPSSASYLRRFVPSPFFVLSETCCLRMLSSSALRSLPGQAQMRASKHRRPKTCPLGREVRGKVSWQLRCGSVSFSFLPDQAQRDPNLPFLNQNVSGFGQLPLAKIWNISYGPLHRAS